MGQLAYKAGLHAGDPINTDGDTDKIRLKMICSDFTC